MGKKTVKPPVEQGNIVFEKDKSIIKEVNRVIFEERIESSEMLRERFGNNPAINAAIMRNAKVVAASLFLVNGQPSANGRKY